MTSEAPPHSDLLPHSHGEVPPSYGGDGVIGHGCASDPSVADYRDTSPSEWGGGFSHFPLVRYPLALFLPFKKRENGKTGISGISGSAEEGPRAGWPFIHSAYSFTHPSSRPGAGTGVGGEK